jgi:histidinol-phosphate aminotransferase
MNTYAPRTEHADPSRQAPEYVQKIARYIPGKPVDELAREFGIDPDRIVKLASNENPRGPGPAVRKAISGATEDLSRYPDGNGFALKSALAARFGVDSDAVVLGNGSNDILELVTQAFLRPGDTAVYSRHAFAVYPLATQARGATGIEVAARADYGHDLPAMRAAIAPTTRVVFVANPNNPTGTWVAPATLESFIASVPGDVLVVLDEAYNEYLAPELCAPSAGWTRRYSNLIVSRTFSKAYGLAALRVGYGLMNARVAEMLNRVRQPFNVNALAQAAALAALADESYVAESRSLNDAGRAELEAGFGKLGLAFVPSHANFVLVKVGDAARVYRRLLEQGVIVRPVANYALPEWLRVTVGVAAENRRFLDALEQALAG